MEQAQIREAGMKAEAEAKNKSVKEYGGDPRHQEMQQQATDPSSNFPEAPLDSSEQLQAVTDNQGPAGSGQGMKTDDKMAIRAPIAGQKGDPKQGARGDMVGGINRHVGGFIATVGDNEGGRKGAGVDFSNATNQI